MQSRIVKNTDFAPGQLESYKGKIGFMEVEGLNFEVKISGARIRFGHLDFQVIPVNGTGAKWVESHRVELELDTSPF
jgi:hypothetical protein